MFMQEIECDLRKLAGFDIGAAEAGRAHGEMQGLGNKWILRVLPGVGSGQCRCQTASATAMLLRISPPLSTTPERRGKNPRPNLRTKKQLSVSGSQFA
jgi:hypothetical protein